jgi:glycosyltransferase involved in cell wall biosynthesis
LPSALEGLPITLLEAMSHGRPCLASDIPPHQGIIRDGMNGLLHRWEDREHLRDRLSEIIHAAPIDLARMGAAARTTVSEEYNWEKVVDQTERLYRQVLANQRPAQVFDPSIKEPERTRPEAVRTSKTSNIERTTSN